MTYIGLECAVDKASSVRIRNTKRTAVWHVFVTVIANKHIKLGMTRDYNFVYETLVVLTVVQLDFLLPEPSNHNEHP
jgi:hypothetical protein